jgi:hypothetical protein
MRRLHTEANLTYPKSGWHCRAEHSSMKRETENAIDLLNNSRLLQGRGSVDASKYKLLDSFAEAKAMAASRSWDCFITDIHNGIFTREIQRQIALEAHDERRWIDTRETIGKKLAPAFRAVSAVPWMEEAFPFELLLADACMELEISHLIPPTFFYPLVFPVLCAGHYPCGWDGEPVPANWKPTGPADLPGGKVMVYLINPAEQH